MYKENQLAFVYNVICSEKTMTIRPDLHDDLQIIVGQDAGSELRCTICLAFVPAIGCEQCNSGRMSCEINKMIVCNLARGWVD